MRGGWIAVFVLVAPLVTWAAPTRPATVEDSVRVRSFARQTYGTTIAISPDELQVAYVAVEGNLQSDTADSVLYLRTLPCGVATRVASDVRDNGRQLLRTQGITAIQWLKDSRTLYVLHSPVGGRPSITRIDTAAGRAEPVSTDPRMDIELFAVSLDGSRLALVGRVPDEDEARRLAAPRGRVITEEDSAWLIENAFKYEPYTREVIVADIGGPQAIVYRSRSTQRHLVTSLTLAPNGRHVTFATFEKDISLPETWSRDPIRNLYAGFAAPPKIIIGDLPERLGPRAAAPIPLRIGYDSYIYGGGNVFWSDDASSYLVAQPSPVGSGSTLGNEAQRNFRPSVNLFAVDADTGAVQLVMSSAPQGIIAFDRQASRIIVKTGPDFVTLQKSSSTEAPWREVGRVSTALGRYLRQAKVAGTERIAVGVEETVSNPPELYCYDFARETTSVLTDINPEVRQQTLGRVEKIEWEGGHGLSYWGHLIYPVAYRADVRYPAVIMAKGWDESFIHGGQAYEGSFPPQALANSGFVVLLLSDRPNFLRAKGLAQLPGRMAEAALMSHQFVTARQQLEHRGLIDITRVGLMGFSRSSWKLDYVLTHAASEPAWAAAVSVDGGLYNYGVYFLTNESRRNSERQFGAAPYGKGFEVWREHAPPFAADKVRTPLLMEYHNSILIAAEFYTALQRQGKPVELIYFPSGKHILDRPLQRVGSMQRVVDWFRFWLQGYERKGPEDPEQYVRWRKLKAQSDWNEALRRAGRDPAAEYLSQSMSAALSENRAPLLLKEK